MHCGFCGIIIKIGVYGVNVVLDLRYSANLKVFRDTLEMGKSKMAANRM